LTELVHNTTVHPVDCTTLNVRSVRAILEEVVTISRELLVWGRIQDVSLLVAKEGTAVTMSFSYSGVLDIPCSQNLVSSLVALAVGSHPVKQFSVLLRRDGASAI